MPDPLTLADERFVALTTYRRSGAAVTTPVWVARHDGALVVTTSPTAGKVKRLRHDPRVTLQPCDRRGRVTEGAVTVPATATVVAEPSDTAAPSASLRAKYRSEWWAVQALLLVERLLRRGPGQRVIIRITAPA